MSKLAALGTTPMLPGATRVAKELGKKMHVPSAGDLSAISASAWKPPAGLTAAAQAAETLRPGKLASVDLVAFLDELEKIANDNELLKEALLGALRQGLQSSVGRAAGAMERGGLGGAGKVLHAFNAPIETGAAGHGLVSAGQHISGGAGGGLLGHLQYGAGKAIEHHGHDLAGGGTHALLSAGSKVLNPAGTLAETGMASMGHAASRGMGLSQGGMGHKVLTKVLPKAGEILGGAGAGAALGAPAGMAGLLGHHAIGASPALTGLAHNAVAAAGTDLAHHVGADLVGTGVTKFKSMIPRAMPAQAHA